MFLVISQVPGIQMRVRRVPRLHISQLWQVFRDKFCPQTQIELVHRSRSFQELKQGTLTIKQFTDKVLTEWDLLLFMGITKSEDEVKNAIMMGLTDRDAQQYAFRFMPMNIDMFVNEVNQYDVLLAIQNPITTSAVPSISSSTSPSALVSEITPLSHDEQMRCYHRGAPDHFKRNCPDIHIPHEELPKWKQVRSNLSSSTSSGYSRGRGRSLSRSRGRRGKYNKGRNNSSYNRQSSKKGGGNQTDSGDKDQIVDVAILETPEVDPVQFQLRTFDWTSVGQFECMDLPDHPNVTLEEESQDYEVESHETQEEYIVLMADIERVDEEPADRVDDNSVVSDITAGDQPLIVDLTDDPDPPPVIQVPTPEVEFQGSEGPQGHAEQVERSDGIPQDEDVVEFMQLPPPLPPSSPISVDLDDESIESEGVRNVVSEELRWIRCPPRNFYTPAESSTRRRYLRSLRVRVLAMKDRLGTKIEQLRWYHRGVMGYLRMRM